MGALCSKGAGVPPPPISAAQGAPKAPPPRPKSDGNLCDPVGALTCSLAHRPKTRFAAMVSSACRFLLGMDRAFRMHASMLSASHTSNPSFPPQAVQNPNLLTLIHFNGGTVIWQNPVSLEYTGGDFTASNDSYLEALFRLGGCSGAPVRVCGLGEGVMWRGTVMAVKAALGGLEALFRFCG